MTTNEPMTIARQLAMLIGEDNGRTAIEAGWRAIRELNSESPQPIVHPGLADYVATAAILAAVEAGLADPADELEQTRAALTASRENAANLANENGRLVAENARLRQQRDDTLAELTDAGNEVDLLEAENKRLRAALIDVGKANGVTHVWDHREKDWVPIAQFAASKAEVPS